MLEAYQFYIKSLKKQCRELQEQSARPLVPTVLCKNVTIYTRRISSCMNRNIFIFNKEIDVTSTSQKSFSTFQVQNCSTTEMPWLKYTFETEIPVSKVSINRAVCIDMTDAYIKINDLNENTTYSSNRIKSDMGSKPTYTFDIQHLDPTII